MFQARAAEFRPMRKLGVNADTTVSRRRALD